MEYNCSQIETPIKESGPNLCSQIKYNVLFEIGLSHFILEKIFKVNMDYEYKRMKVEAYGSNPLSVCFSEETAQFKKE